MPTALIVGASRGLGRALAEQYLARGWQVIATVRDAAKLADLAQDALTIETLETTDWPAVDVLKERLAGGTLDLLFVNAAISPDPMILIGAVEPEDFAEAMLTNVLAPLRIVDRLADLTAEDATIAVMSSHLASIAENTNARAEAYRISKAGLNMGLRSIAARRADGRTYIAADPGWVRTEMGGPSAALAIDESIPSLTNVLEQHRRRGGIHFVNYAGRVWPW
jgi:NAD(P)-dependent dehydrogenase (short-subunit alcohol dehydrogenase family)